MDDVLSALKHRLEEGLQAGKSVTLSSDELALARPHAQDLCHFLELAAKRNGAFRDAVALAMQIAPDLTDLDGPTLYLLGVLHIGAHNFDTAEIYFSESMRQVGRKKLALNYLAIIQEFRKIVHLKKLDLSLPASPPLEGSNQTQLFQSEVGYVHLTIDDGPNPETTPQLLELFRKYKQTVTFFVPAQGALNFPELIAAMLDGGHQIFGHSFNHNKIYPEMSVADCIADINATEDVLTKIRGRQDVTYYRFPGGQGHFHDEIRAELALHRPDIRLVHWHAFCEDSTMFPRFHATKDGRVELLASLARLLYDVRGAGEILLTHEPLYRKTVSEAERDMVIEYYDLMLHILSERNIRCLALPMQI